jgi:hypothetical protein
MSDLMKFYEKQISPSKYSYITIFDTLLQRKLNSLLFGVEGDESLKVFLNKTGVLGEEVTTDDIITACYGEEGKKK